MSTTAFPVEQQRPSTIGGEPVSDQLESSTLTYAITMTGCPSISVPCGFTPEGVPVGMQIVGPRLREDRVLRAAAAFERAAPWAHRRPPLAGER
jgi:Asp-tRNA(Asn)/Glu-tRNA(Gln) amidotransferase A subunit family amidase